MEQLCLLDCQSTRNYVEALFSVTSNVSVRVRVGIGICECELRGT